MTTKVPALKNIPPKLDRELRDTLQSMKEAQEIRLGRLGDPLDRAVTLRELINSGLAKSLSKKPFDPNGTGQDFIPGGEEEGDLTIPPAPTGLTASGVFTEIIVDWNPAQYSNHAYTEVWRSRDDEIGTATLITTTSSFIITDAVGYDETYFYWVRFVSTSNVKGPFNQTNGTKAETVENIGAVMQQLSEDLSNLPGYSALATNTSTATIVKSSSEPSTRSNGDALQPNDIWFDTDDGQIYTRNTANSAWVAGRDATLVNLFGSTSFTGSTLTAAMATAQSDIITVTNAQSSTATSLTNLTANVNTNSSNVSQLLTTTANINGDLNAMYVLQVSTESNGSVSAAGMVIGSNAQGGSGAQSYVQFQADKFAIWNGSSATAPFIVSGGTVFIDSARIQDGAITNARIANLAVQEGKIANLAVTEGKIASLAVTTAKIADLAVTNAKINNLSATKITSDQLDSARINVDTLNVKHFDNVSTDIKAHTGAFVPLQVFGSSFQRGSTNFTTQTQTTGTYLSTTIGSVRNGAKYQAIWTGVYGDCTNGVLEYSVNGSTYVQAAGGLQNVTMAAGTFRTYVFAYSGTISGLSSTSTTVYWRVRWITKLRSTYQSLYVFIDNTQ